MRAGLGDGDDGLYVVFVFAILYGVPIRHSPWKQHTALLALSQSMCLRSFTWIHGL